MNLNHLESYIQNFYGYGSWDADLWFVGMEEGGGSSVDEFSKRLAVWAERDCRPLEDAIPYHQAFGHTKWVPPGRALQSTWKALIHIYLAREGLPRGREDIRAFQTTRFGSPASGFAALELFPLPSPTVSHWFYGELESLPYLASRAQYTDHLYPSRAAGIRERILEHRPRDVVMYGKTYRERWEGVIEQSFSECALEEAMEAHLGETRVLFIPHPVAKGISGLYWGDVGDYLRG